MKMRRLWGNGASFLFLLVFSVLMLFPLVWMLSTALKPSYNITADPTKLLPDPAHWRNFVDLFHKYPIATYTWNTLYISVLNIIGKLISCSLVAYGFAKYKAPGKDVLFGILLATMMLPWAVTMVPLFIFYREIGWYNTFLPLWVPSFFGDAFSIFLLRQFMMGVPNELEEAAKIDGAHLFKILWHVVLPIIQPALVVVAIFSFFHTWNDFLGPLLFLSDPEKATLQIGIRNLRTQYDVEWNYMMGLSLLSVIPCLIVFFFGQRKIVDGITMSGLKA
ncbi:carbohydrate ABC transporter permease [Cohnella hongkongensis]|uniref:Carbohydrate ABC transporter permease n=1 Tax=Cohnella hongkongensis TaxID=178337 RepID=A0ABV9FJ10_9BACL